MYLHSTLRTYLEDASAGTPTPGGGSVAALTGALGMSMACMASNFTVGNKKYESVQQEAGKLLADCLRARDELIRLMDEDVQGYAKVSAAYGMPKGNAEQKRLRAEAIQDSLKCAMQPPLLTLRVCRDTLPSIERLVEVGNPNLISDVGVAALLAEAALRAAKMNVEINLSCIKDESLVASIRAEIEQAARDAKISAESVLDKVAVAIGGSA